MKIKEIIEMESADLSAEQKAVQAAYWAGQANGRAQERLSLAARVVSLPAVPWHKLQARIVEALAPSEDMRSIDGLREEEAEILAWEACGS